MHYPVLVAWALCIFLAFTGYGRAALYLLRVQDTVWPLAITTGVSVILFVGGLLNLAADLRPAVLCALIAIGDVLFCFGYVRPRRLFLAAKQTRVPLSSRSTIWLGLLLFLLVSVPVLRSLRAQPLSFSFDDWAAYLTLPVQTFQLHTLPPDPFNERRVTSSLGGSYFLQTFMLLVGDVRTLRFADVGMGFIAYPATLFWLFRALRLPVRTSLILLFLIFLAPLNRMNLTMVVLPAALFVAMLLIEIHPSLGSELSWRRAVLLGVTAAAVSSLKSNYLPPALLICGFYYCLLLFSSRATRVLANAALASFVMMLALLPWMLDLKAKEGTYLFPILGRGYDASAYGFIPLPSGSNNLLGPGSKALWLAVILIAGPLILGAAYVVFRRNFLRMYNWPALVSFFLACAVSIVVVSTSTGGASMGRYIGPFAFPSLFVLLGLLITLRSDGERPILAFNCLTGTAVLAILFAAALNGVRNTEYLHWIQEAGISSPVAPYGIELNISEEQRRAVRAQAAIPPGESLIAHMFVTFPFDFRRNSIFVADWIGMAGPAPGMPIGKGPEFLRLYLLNHQIRYLAYDPERAPYPEAPSEKIVTILANPRAFGRYGWVNVQSGVAREEEQSIAALGAAYRHVYDDDRMFVLDLRAPRE